jgi:hypothetical protein
VTQVLAEVRAHLRSHFAQAGLAAEPDSASVTFLGVEKIDVLRFGPDADGVVHFVSLGCSRHPMSDPSDIAADPLQGPRAEVVVSLRNTVPTPGLARTVALLAATPAVDGVVLVPDALIDLGAALWLQDRGRVPFSAVLLGLSDIADLRLDPPRDPVRFLSAVPVSANEGAWLRLKGAGELRQTWEQDGTDVLDPTRLH